MVSPKDISDWLGQTAVWGNQSMIQNQASWTHNAIVRPSVLHGAKEDSVAFFFNPQYKDQLLNCSAGVLVTGHPFVKPLLDSGLPLLKKTIVIACDDPYGAMATLSEKFWNLNGGASVEHGRAGGIHKTASIDESSKLSDDVLVSENVVIGKSCTIGKRVILYPNVVIGNNCTLGDDCVIFPNVTIYSNVHIGDRVRVHASSVIGADGFGYAQVMDSNKKPIQHKKIYHFGSVRIGNDVELGSGVCVDRGTFGETVIEDEVKIDNMVQVAHNCVVGKGTIMCGTSGLAGSASTGKFAVLGGGSAVSNQVHLADYTQVTALSGVAKDTQVGDVLAGMPARPAKEHFRIMAMLNRMVKNDRSKK